MASAAQARQDYAAQLYTMRGLTYAQVAEEDNPARPGTPLYSSAGAARIAVLASIARANGLMDPGEYEPGHAKPAREPSPEEIRLLLYARHEALITAWMPRATRGGVDSVNAARIVKDALAAQALLSGANTRPAPARVPSGSGGEADEVDDLAHRRAQRRAAARGAAPPTSAGPT